MAERLRERETYFKADEREGTIKSEGDRIQVGFKRLNDNATIPSKAHASDSGFDLVASTDVIIEPGETAVVPTGIAVQLPSGYEAQVRPRSGVTSKTKLRVQLGTIDNGYTGEIGVIVDNIAQLYDVEDINDYYNQALTIDGKTTSVPTRRRYMTYKIRKGDRIAQLVIQPLPAVEAYEVDSLDDTERGTSGYGSSGVGSDG